MRKIKFRRELKTGLMLAVLCGLGLARQGTALADLDIQTGIKWTPVSYTTPVGIGSESNADPKTAAVPGQQYANGLLYGWQSTTLDSYLAFFFHEQVAVQLSLDFGYSQHANSTTDAGSFNTSYFQFGFGVGGKFYILRPLREKVVPFVTANFFKYFATVSTDDPKVTDAMASAVAGFRSPIGFDASFGVEYFVTDGFSIGAEVFGLRFAHVQGDIPATGDVSISSQENYLTFFTGISLNYRFRSVVKSKPDETVQPGQHRTAPATRQPAKQNPPANNEIPPLDTSPEAID